MRTAKLTRETSETKISLEFNLDGTGEASVSTGIGFFDHMLLSFARHGFARHGFFDLQICVNGDLEVDGHHTIEDTGIVLGMAIAEALGDKKGIRRYGSSILPMDETLCLCAADLSGRPYLNFDMRFTTDRVGYFDTEMAKEFFYAVAVNAKMNLHIKQLAGENNHHLLEAAFKAFARALDEAAAQEERVTGVLSAKGML